jgi:hypothetical protein
MAKKRRPTDINLLAHQIMQEATGQIKEEASAPPDGKNPAAVALGRLGGLKGGKARADKLSAKKRKEIAQKAASARWNKYEIIDRKIVYRGSPMITVTTVGRLSFNKGAAEIIKKEAIENVLLLYDKERRYIGIRSIAKKDPRSYQIHWNKRGDGAGFSATTFLKIIEYSASETRTFPLLWDEHQQMFEIALPEDCFTKGGFIGSTKPRKKDRIKQPNSTLADKEDSSHVTE